MNPLRTIDSPHPDTSGLSIEETSREEQKQPNQPSLVVPHYQRETAATMNRSRKIEDDETQDPASHAPERRASSGLSREHGKNDLFEPNVRVPGRYPSFTDGFQPLDISDDSDDGAFDSELPLRSLPARTRSP
ncbi:hypothetical protein P3342_004626 [Pyrenophora teres f. teres]|nr:hypothetical protein P3342_004626 [Pyrenophora teres f. teres]